MGFLEELRKNSEHILDKAWDRVSLDLRMGRKQRAWAETGRDATIEALKEMMVGEPIKARATWGSGYNITYLWGVKQPGNTLGLEDGKGKEVSVIVVKRGGGAQRGLDAHKTYVPPTAPHQDEDKR